MNTNRYGEVLNYRGKRSRFTIIEDENPSEKQNPSVKQNPSEEEGLFKREIKIPLGVENYDITNNKQNYESFGLKFERISEELKSENLDIENKKILLEEIIPMCKYLLVVLKQPSEYWSGIYSRLEWYKKQLDDIEAPELFRKIISKRNRTGGRRLRKTLHNKKRKTMSIKKMSIKKMSIKKMSMKKMSMKKMSMKKMNRKTKSRR
jgi:hypothetical protein